MTNYDVVVIGAGSGGLTAAVGFAKVGKKVLLVEREHLGGECTNSGCVPSKALLHHAKTYHAASEVAGPSDDLEAYRNDAFPYVRRIVDAILAEETPEVFEAMGIDVVLGEAKFVSRCAVAVNDTEYRFQKAVIATGSSPRHIDIEGLPAEKLLTNQNFFDLTEIPERLLVIGSGPINLELGQAMALLSSQVSIATIDDRLARLEDPAVGSILAEQFTKLGIAVHCRAYISHVEDDTAVFDIKEEAGGGEAAARQVRIPFDQVLLAIGRVPNLPPGLEAANIKAGEHGIVVDSQNRTSNQSVYALGDVADRLKFTHVADDTARQVVTREVSRGWLRVNRRKAVPKVTYTQPEVAQVGLSETEANAKYRQQEIMRLEVSYHDNDRAKTDTDTEGLMVVLVRRLNGTVLGANIIGPAAGELISIFTLAIEQKVSMWQLRRLIYPYPTYSLLIKKAGDQFLAQQLNDLKRDLLALLRKHLPKIIAAIFWAALIYAFQHYRISQQLSYTDVLFDLLDFFTSTMWGPLVYMVLYAIRPLIFFPATLLTALSGALFGFWWGIMYTIVGENASANFAYWIGRFFSKDLKLEDTAIGNWVTALRKRPFEAVLFMRLFYFPFDLTNYGSGILKVRWRAYFLATLIGIMPGLTTFVALGAALDLSEFGEAGLSFDVFDPRFLALSVTIFVGSLVLSRGLRRFQAAK